MMGRTHAATGALAGLLVGPLAGLDSAVEVAPFAAITAGYALLPDLDHASAAATRLLGPLTGLLSRLLRACSAAVYARTKGPCDEPSGEHRHLSHTAVFALLVGGVCAASTVVGGPWTVVAWLVFGLLLATDRLGWPALAAFGIGAVAWLPATASGPGVPDGHVVLAALDASTGWLGLAVALGCLVHCLGDAVTEFGCPFLWPVLPIRGETWYEIRPPAWLRFRTGQRFERLIVFPAVVLGCLAAIPGLLPHVLALFSTPDHVVSGGGPR